MIGIRRFFSRQQHRGDYDAVPLSDLQPNEGRSQSPIERALPLQPSSTLTIRKAGLTVLSTILVYTTFVLISSGFRSEPEPIPVEISYTLSQAQLSGAGGFYRDAYPIKSMLKYWDIAEREVKERGLDTCKGQLSRELVDAYVRSVLDYCHPAVCLKSTLLIIK